MTDKEALRMALDALELNNDEWKSLADSGDCGYWNAEDQDHYKQTNEAITAIKQALAAQQEPVGVFVEDDDIGHIRLIPHQQLKLKDGDKLYTTPPAQPAQPAPVTEGWKQVPVEPTDEMLDAAQNVVTDIYRVDADRVYTAMVQASNGIKENI
jgi:hypothetical protein